MLPGKFANYIGFSSTKSPQKLCVEDRDKKFGQLTRTSGQPTRAESFYTQKETERICFSSGNLQFALFCGFKICGHILVKSDLGAKFANTLKLSQLSLCVKL